MPHGKILAQQGLTAAYPQRNTRARFNAFLFNVLTPPKGGCPPFSNPPGRLRRPPIPPGALPLGLRPHPKSCAPMARVLTKPGCAGPGCSTALQPRSKRLRPSASGRPDLPRKRGTLRALRHRINHARRVLRPRRPLNRARSAPWNTVPATQPSKSLQKGGAKPSAMGMKA